MNQNLKNDLCVLNIFKDEKQFIEEFIRHHAKIVKYVVMLNTGNVDVYNLAKRIAGEFDNVEVYYQTFEHVDFSAFRNTCLKFAPNDVQYYCWVDTDEMMIVNSDAKKFNPNSEVIRLERVDESRIFSTFLTRIYRNNVIGSWKKRIHEHFQLDGDYICETVDWLTIDHLTSEAKRTKEKKQLYFSLLEGELADAKHQHNRQAIIDNLQHLILMASHDFRDPELCLKYYREFKGFIDTSTIYEISNIQKFNVYLHALLSYSRLGKKPPNGLIDSLYAIDKTRSSMFQVLRALVLNPDNVKRVKKQYLNEYQFIKEDQTTEFNNTDYKNIKEVLWLEKKLGLINVK